jgi:hypothetical protein
MDFFNKIGDSIQNVSKETAKKAKDLSGSVSLNSEIKEYENNLEKLYKTLGEKYYKVYTAEAEDRYPEISARIKEILGKIEADKKNLRGLKGMQLCPHCKAEVDMAAIHCPMCGTFLKPQTVEEVLEPTQKQAFCPGCGEAIAPGIKFCGKCGTKLSE